MEYDHLLDKVKKIHMIGIGGSGMCPIAEILHTNGYVLTGSDCALSDTLERIKGYGIKVYMGHEKENITDQELVVYTAAVKKDNPELVAAREKNIPCIERSIMLGIITRKFKRSIAVSGTHGKTTTTGMLTQILVGAGLDPSAVIGGKLNYIGGNGCAGKSDIVVAEACEYVDTFLQLNPYLSIILNIDADHLDYFKNIDNIKKSFNKFAHQTTNTLVINGDDKNTLDAVEDVTITKITFGKSNNNDYYCENLKIVDKAFTEFDLMHKNEKLCTINLQVPGIHNVYDALAACATAHTLGVSPEEISKNIHEFTGVHRRFEILGKIRGITIADDFAHHPTEIAATLTAAQKMGFNKIWTIFQPHTYSRTSMLLNEFAEALKISDTAIISEILAVREDNIYNVYNTDLGKLVPDSICIDSFTDITKYICDHAKEGDLILTMGGGNVYMCANMILRALTTGEY